MRFTTYKEEFLLPWECFKLFIGTRYSKINIIIESKKWLTIIKKNQNYDHGNRRGNIKVQIIN